MKTESEIYERIEEQEENLKDCHKNGGYNSVMAGAYEGWIEALRWVLGKDE